MSDNPLSPAQQAVLADALRLVRGQRTRTASVTVDPASRWTTPFGLGYFVGVVDGLCQVHGAPFDGMALGVLGLVLDDTFGRERSDALRNQALDLLEANDPDFSRGRPWGGNEAMGLAHGHTPVGLVHLAQGHESRMG
ncbi:MAG: hypothetical protein AAF845_19410 [Bacteroidota bacterium]